MFDIDKFSDILKTIVSKYNSITNFADTAGVGRSYISKYINKRIKVPPQPRVLSKIAATSKGETTYEELMKICGYYEDEVKRMNEEEQLKYNGDPKYLELCYPNDTEEQRIKKTNLQIDRLNNLKDALQQQLNNLFDWETQSKIKLRNQIEETENEIKCFQKMIKKLKKN